SESRARAYLSGLLKDHAFGAVAEAVDALARTDVAEPRAWIRGYIRRRYPDALKAGKGTWRAPISGQTRPEAPRADRPHHPESTPECLGVSPGRVEEIRRRSRGFSISILDPASPYYR